MRKGVAHLRVSTRRQGRSGLGLTAQRRIIRQYCKANKIKIVKEFIEIGSGRPRKRPVAQKTIDYCRKHNLTLYVANQSRLARNVGFIYDLIESSFEFISVDSPAATKLEKLFKAIIDEKAGDDISDNTKHSLVSAKKKGVKFGGNSAKRKRTLKRKRRKYLKRIKPVIRREQKKQQQEKKRITVRVLTARLNSMRLKKVNGKRGGWHVSEVHGILRELTTLK